MIALQILWLALLASQPIAMSSSIYTDEQQAEFGQQGGNVVGQAGSRPYQARQMVILSNPEMPAASNVQELDSDGFTLKQPVDEKRIIDVLLENLDPSWIRPSQMLRTSRNSAISENRVTRLAEAELKPEQQLLELQSERQQKQKQQKQQLTAARKPMGFTWQPNVGAVEGLGRPGGGNHGDWHSGQPHRLPTIIPKQSSLASYSSQQLQQAQQHQQQNRRSGSDEVAIHPTPMHPRSFDSKRVENNRWTTLRGMWGKRNSKLSQEQEQQQLQQQLLAYSINGASGLFDSFAGDEQQSNDKEVM